MKDDNELNVDIDGDVDDPSAICPDCKQSTFIGETIACEVCNLWFHFVCQGIKPTDDVAIKEDIPFYCTKCRKPSGKATPRKQNKREKKRKSEPKSKPKSKPKPPPKTTATVGAGIKLKINLGKTSSSSSLITSEPLPTTSASLKTGGVGSSAKKKPPANNSVTETEEDEEKKWLDAVEAGNFPGTIDPELKSIKDPKLMTARQRAMTSAGDSGMAEDESMDGSGHISLSYGYKKKEENEHTIRVKALKSQKRKEVEMEKREQDKKKTVDRLLNKKEKNVKVAKTTKAGKKKDYPKISYRITLEGASISMPTDYHLPFSSKRATNPPHIPVKCAVEGCDNPKSYCCSKTGVALCSLQCYKKNLLT